jgi:hypothetical protein
MALRDLGRCAVLYIPAKVFLAMCAVSVVAFAVEGDLQGVGWSLASAAAVVCYLAARSWWSIRRQGRTGD